MPRQSGTSSGCASYAATSTLFSASRCATRHKKMPKRRTNGELHVGENPLPEEMNIAHHSRLYVAEMPTQYKHANRMVRRERMPTLRLDNIQPRLRRRNAERYAAVRCPPEEMVSAPLPPFCRKVGVAPTIHTANSTTRAAPRGKTVGRRNAWF